MAKSKGFNAPEGFSKKNNSAPFINFQEGDVFHGVFLKTETTHSVENGDGQAWLVKALGGDTGCTAGKNKENIIAGQMYMIGEKTSMRKMTLELSAGEEFYLEYEGEMPSTKRKGKTFKAFNLYMAE